jgi:TatD DNase family protein
MIDTHCHIDLFDNPIEVLNEAEKLGITVLAVTNLPSHFEMGYPHILPFKKIRLALGLHPLYADKHNIEFPSFEKYVSLTSYIGEVGLDFSKEGYTTKDIQLASFSKVLNLVTGKKKILSLHSRKAEKEVLAMLIQSKIKSAIFHWYSGPLSLIDEIAASGYYFSINPAMVSLESGKKIIGRIPIDKILVETDGPFVMVADRPAEPTDVKLVYEYLALKWSKSFKEASNLILQNFQTLIGEIR